MDREKMDIWRWRQRMKSGFQKSNNNKDCPQPPEAMKQQEEVLPQNLQRQHGDVHTCISGL